MRRALTAGPASTPADREGRRRLRLGALLALVALVLAACGIPLDRTPRDIASEPGADVSNTGAAAGGTAGGARIYFATTDAQSAVRLQQVYRSVLLTPNDVLGALFKGLTDVEARRLTTQIPLGTKLLAVGTTSDGLVVINVDRTIFQAQKQALVVAVAQIVYTATSLPGIDRVRLLVDGAPGSWPAGDGRQRDGDLTPLAYPSLYPVNQPDLPPVPSPTTVAPPTLAPTTTLAPAPTTTVGRVVISPSEAATTTATAPAPPPASSPAPAEAEAEPQGETPAPTDAP